MTSCKSNKAQNKCHCYLLFINHECPVLWWYLAIWYTLTLDCDGCLCNWFFRGLVRRHWISDWFQTLKTKTILFKMDGQIPQRGKSLFEILFEYSLIAQTSAHYQYWYRILSTSDNLFWAMRKFFRFDTESFYLWLCSCWEPGTHWTIFYDPYGIT